MLNIVYTLTPFTLTFGDVYLVVFCYVFQDLLPNCGAMNLLTFGIFTTFLFISPYRLNGRNRLLVMDDLMFEMLSCCAYLTPDGVLLSVV